GGVWMLFKNRGFILGCLIVVILIFIGGIIMSEYTEKLGLTLPASTDKFNSEAYTRTLEEIDEKAAAQIELDNHKNSLTPHDNIFTNMVMSCRLRALI